MAGSRLVCWCVLGVSLSGCGATRAPAPPPTPPRAPTEADFVGYPSCVLYLAGADTRIRVRARRAHRVCLRLAVELGAPGARWSLEPGRAKEILSPFCRLANPRRTFELDVIDDATGAGRGPEICASLAGAGWFDLSPP